MTIHAEQSGFHFGRSAATAEGTNAHRLGLHRGDILFVLMCIMVLTGSLVPLPALALDLGWIFVLSLGAGLILMCLFLRDTAQAGGIPSIMFLWSMGHIWLVCATTRSLFLNKAGGIVIETLGGIFQFAGTAGGFCVIGVILAAGLVSLGLIGARFDKRCRAFLEEIIPLKRISLETDLNAGLISEEQKTRIEETMYGQAELIMNLPRAWRILICDLVISMMVLTVLAVQAGMIGLMKTMPGRYALEASVLQCTGASVLFTGVVISLGWAAVSLTGRNVMNACKGDKANGKDARQTGRKSRKIRIVNSPSRKQDVVELLNPESCLLPGKVRSRVDPETMEIEPARLRSLKQDAALEDTVEEIIVELDDTVMEGYFETEQKQESAETPCGSESQRVRETDHVIPAFHRFDSADAYFAQIRELILYHGEEGRAVALCSQGREALSVRTVFHTALALCEEDQKTLVIDMDPGRNALARAFEVEPSDFADGPVETCLESISIWSCEDIDRFAAEKLLDILEKYRHDFDQVILSVPNLASMRCPVHLTRAAGTAIVFADREEDSQVICDLFEDSPCRVLGLMLSPEKAIR